MADNSDNQQIECIAQTIFDLDVFPPNRTGHPFTLTPKIWLETCLDYESGTTILKACEKAKIKAPEYYWLQERFPELSERHARADRIRAHLLISQAQEIADDKAGDTIQGARGESGNMANVRRAECRIGLRERLAALFNEKYRKVETLNVNQRGVNVSVQLKPGTNINADELTTAFLSGLK